MSTLSIRRAKSGDEVLMLELLLELAEYEKLTHLFRLNAEKIARDFFAPLPAAFCDIAFVGDRPVGLATWYWTYSSFAAMRGVYLEDLYVRPEQRGRGYGKSLLAHLARTAVKGGAGRVEWSVLNWNKPSIDFYESLGAKPSTEWTVYRLADEPLLRLAKE
jgi:GNAT superfamily N-acetyltransferase